jgi:ornithine cyclodeaminase
MSDVLVLHEAEIRERARFDLAALNAVEGAFVALAEGRAMMPPVMHMAVRQPPGDIDVKGAVIDGLPIAVVKIGAGFFQNRHLGLPSSTAMMVAVSAETGRCTAVLLDNGYLTDLRTALAGAVAARHLAPGGALNVGVIGAGAQARYQVEALMIEKRVRELFVHAHRPEQAADLRRDMEERIGIAVTVCGSVTKLSEASDLIVTATPSRKPLLRADQVRPGQHITAVGSDLPGKCELSLDLLQRADLLVCDNLAESQRLGELQGAEAALIDSASELGELIRRGGGRPNDQALTVCDLSGLGVQDTAIAAHVLRSQGDWNA